MVEYRQRAKELVANGVAERQQIKFEFKGNDPFKRAELLKESYYYEAPDGERFDNPESLLRKHEQAKKRVLREAAPWWPMAVGAAIGGVLGFLILIGVGRTIVWVVAGFVE
jgi:hypothetical protein